MPTIKQHDIIITDPSTSVQIGLNLAKDKNFAPLYAEFDSKYLAEQFFTGAASYSNLPPEQDLALIQDDWRASFGLEYFDSNEPKRYFSSYGMDLRHRGKAIAGWNSTPATLPTLFSLTDGELDVWTDANNLTNWTFGQTNGTLTREAVTIYSGTYSAKIDVANVAASFGKIYQTLGNWSDDFRNTTVTVTVWAKTATANNCRIGIHDGGAETFSSYHTGGGGWEQLAVTRKLNAGALSLKITCYCDAVNSTAYFDLVEVPTLGAHGLCWAEFDSDLFFSSNKCLLRVNNSTGTITYQAGFPAAITSLQVFGSNLFIALGTSNSYWYMSTAEVCTESTAAVKTFQYFCTVLGATDYLWGNDGGNTLRSNTNPINGGAAWSGQTTVGSSSFDITQLLSWQDTLYIRKQDKVYYLDATPSVHDDLAHELATATSDAPGEMWVWLKKLYIPAGTQALLESDGATNTWRNPADYCSNLSSFVGEIFAGAGDTFWNYVIVDNDTKVEILAGREETIDGSTDWVWHPIHEITLAGCQACCISTVFQNRLWVASTSAAQSLYYLPLPTQYGNIESDSNRTFKTNTYFETPWLHGNFKADNKAFIKVTGTLGHDFDAGKYFECWYKKLGGAYVDAGDLTGTATNRSPSLFFATDTTSTMLRLMFIAKTDHPSYTPILLAYDVRAILYPTIRKFISCVVKIKDDTVNKMGIIKHNRYTLEKNCMDNLRAATWPATMIDIDGNTVYVKYMPLSSNTPRYSIVKSEKGAEQYRHYNLMLQVIQLN